MNKIKLDSDEEKLLKAFEAGEIKSVLTPARKKMIQESAEHAFKKDKQINIRISSRVLDALQKRAFVEGIPYQTLVSSVLHKYGSGSLKEVTAKALQSGLKTSTRPADR